MDILKNINSPLDIKTLDNKELEQLAEETREFIIENVDKTGGHLTPSLGVVELTIALHKVFDMPKDKIVWDVGHQAYAHKIYTGRREVFHTNRQFKGISGFIKPSESEYDSFAVGHASTSISAGYGFVAASAMKGEENNVISVIGDGSITGGLAFEGLNNAGASKRKFLVILNDNEMSISKNVGALSKYLATLLSDKTFNKLKNEIWNITGKYKLGRPIRKGLSRIEKSVKTLLTPGVLFEKLGFNYIGPIDGHDIGALTRVLENIKNDISGPVFLHVITEKGRGFKAAEQDVKGTYHGVAPGILHNGTSESKVSSLKYQDVFGISICKLADKNDKIVAITAAMKVGTGLSEFGDKYPERIFDVGIAEEHAVTFSAALAMEGFKPIVAIYSTFLQRSLDQIIHDCALQELNMVFALDRAGIVGEDGPTHHGVFDLSYLRFIPGLIMMSPRNERELLNMLYTSVEESGLFAIRYPRGTGTGENIDVEPQKLEIGKGEKLVDGKNIAFLTIGNITNNVIKAVDLLKKNSISCSVYDMKFIKPLDRNMIKEAYDNHDCIITVEENSVVGGFGSGILEDLNRQGIYDAKVKIIGIEDEFVEHGSMEKLFELLNLHPEGLAKTSERFFNNK
ncbi:MAG: 1-deoxy-D-xylulose-5-phosphate synthase [Candidatus Delongbacteria bacterium]|jgi:1-deoxy-D-xylulose-5-phosphate synthase|nr:1-deoxy-D-xylulose-5-phosphate synthase [Candidatus Delongbacteria bacterium]